MDSYGYLQSIGAPQESNLSFSYIICIHQQEKNLKDIVPCILHKLATSSIDYIIHFHRKSGEIWLIPLESDTCEQLLDKEPELVDNAEHIPDNCDSLLVTKNGQINVFNEHKEKVRNAVHRINKTRFNRKINIENINSETNESCEATEAVSAKTTKIEHTDTGIYNEAKPVKKFVHISHISTLLYFSRQLKYGKSTICRPTDEVFSVAGKNEKVKLRKIGERRNKNSLKRKSWHVFEDENMVSVKIYRNVADDSDTRENYFHEFNTVSVSPTKSSEKGKYSPTLIRHLREITNLPRHERPRQYTVLAYPTRKGKFNKPTNTRRGRTHNSQATEGVTDQYPTQVSDAANESLDLPSAELVQTSSRSIFRTLTNNIQAPTTNLMPTTHSERALISRIRGQLPVSRFSQPQQPPKHPQYADQPSRQRSFSNWPSNTGQDSTRMAIYGFFYTGRFDLIRCFQCGIGLKDWAAPDEPLFEHIKHSPECKFLKELLGEDLHTAYRNNLLANQTRPTTNPAVSSTGSRPPAAGGIRSPQYSELQSRVRSFDNWPTTSLQQPQMLADAGMYYTGFNDLCRCFTCDGGLQRWDVNDNPWIEHARWFPNCAYVKQIKGQDYINMVLEAANLLREENENPAVVNPIPAQHRGNTGSVEQGLANLTLKETDPLNTAAAQSVVSMGYSRRAVLLAVHEHNGQARGERTDYMASDLVRILTERQDRGEALPPDSPTDEGATGGIFVAENMDPQEENYRLKGILKCLLCKENDTNILFLPCTHHRLCEECAADAINCPICGRKIDDKIKTFMS